MVEALEDVGEVLLGNAWAGVLHTDAAGYGVLAGRNAHGAASGRVLHAVLEHVGQGLAGPGGVAHEGAAWVYLGQEGHAGKVRGHCQRLLRGRDQRGNVDAATLEAHHACVQARELEQ